IKERELISGQHPLIDNRPAGKTGNVKHAAFVNAALRCFADSLANHAELSLEGEIIGKLLTTADKELPNNRFRGPRGRAKRAVVCRHVAPTQNRLTFFLGNLFK